MNERNPQIIRRVRKSNRTIQPATNRREEVFQRTTITKTQSISKNHFNSPPSSITRKKHVRMSHREPPANSRPIHRQMGSLRNFQVTSGPSSNLDQSMEAIQRRAYGGQVHHSTANLNTGTHLKGLLCANASGTPPEEKLELPQV